MPSVVLPKVMLRKCQWAVLLRMREVPFGSLMTTLALPSGITVMVLVLLAPGTVPEMDVPLKEPLRIFNVTGALTPQEVSARMASSRLAKSGVVPPTV